MGGQTALLGEGLLEDVILVIVGSNPLTIIRNSHICGSLVIANLGSARLVSSTQASKAGLLTRSIATGEHPKTAHVKFMQPDRFEFTTDVPVPDPGPSNIADTDKACDSYIY